MTLANTTAPLELAVRNVEAVDEGRRADPGFRHGRNRHQSPDRGSGSPPGCRGDRSGLRAIRRLLKAPTRPLWQLTADVQGFGVDDIDRRVAVAGDREFRAVGRAFNSMADRLQGTLSSLEHRLSMTLSPDCPTGLSSSASFKRPVPTSGRSSCSTSTGSRQSTTVWARGRRRGAHPDRSAHQAGRPTR